MRVGTIMTALLAAVAVGACGGDSASGPADEYARVAGSYTLVALNGKPLPALLVEDATIRVDITSATLVLRANRTFTESLDSQVKLGASEAQSERQVHNGTFQLSGATASFTVPAANGFSAFGFTGTINGTVLTYTDELGTYRYERR